MWMIVMGLLVASVVVVLVVWNALRNTPLDGKSWDEDEQRWDEDKDKWR